MSEEKSTYAVQPPRGFFLLRWRAIMREYADRPARDDYERFARGKALGALDATRYLAEVMEAVEVLQGKVTYLEGLFDRWSKAVQQDVISRDVCPVCKGEGQIELPPGETGRVTKINCCECRGSGRLPPVDVRSLEERVNRLATRVGAMEQQSESKTGREEEET